MLLFQSSLGVEIAEDSIAVVYLKGSFKGIILVDHSFHPIEKDLSLADRLAVVGDIVGDFIKKNRISATSIFLGIPKRSAVVRFIELPMAMKENLLESLGYEIEKYAPFPADRAYFDCQILQEDASANKMKVLLVLSKREAIDPYLALRDRWNIGISGAEISSTGKVNYLSCLPRTISRDPYIALSLGSGSLDLNLIDGNLLNYSRSVTIPEDPNNLYSFILRELKSFEEASGQNGKMKVVVLTSTGEADTARRLQEDMDVEILSPDVPSVGFGSPALIAAYGLALKGIRKVPMDINLIPLGLRKKPSRAAYYTMLVLAAILVLSLATLGISSIMRDRLHLKALNSEIARLSVEIKDFEKLGTRCQELENEIDFLNGVRGNPVNFLNILKDLSERIPKNAWVSSLTFSGQGLQIGGYAESASSLIPRLEASPLLKDAVFLSSITKTKDGKERFEIGLKIR